MVTRAQVARCLPFHRIGQFVQALTARPLSPAEWREIATVLSLKEQSLFRRMHTGDQRHSLEVMRTLVAMGETDHALLTAALLHDVGKSRYPLRLWERPVVVVIHAYRPSIAGRWGLGEPKGWRRPFVIYQQHAEWGAEMAAANGCPPLVVQLIRLHQNRSEAFEQQETPVAELLSVLQLADSAN